MEQRLSMTTLAVADLPRTRRFFTEGLGWTEAAGGTQDIVFYQLPGSVLALYARAALEKDLGRPLPQTTLGGVTLAWNGRSETEVDQVFAEALDAGAEVIAQPEKVFWGGYSGYVSIPGGHLLEIAFNPFWPLHEDGTLRLPG